MKLGPCELPSCGRQGTWETGFGVVFCDDHCDAYLMTDPREDTKGDEWAEEEMERRAREYAAGPGRWT